MTAFDVAVLRFTPRLAEVRRLLELLGLRPQLVSERGTYVELVGAGGRVHLHHADDVETVLVLRCDEVARAHRDLAADGIEAERWDESFGELMSVPGPRGSRIEVAEAQRDLHGYRELPAGGARGIVTAVWYTTDVAADVPAFAPYGLTPEGHGDDAWQALAARGGQGAVGLHRAEDREPSDVSGEVELSLVTDEPLDDLEARLGAAGYATRRLDDEFVSLVAVTDPDGLELQVHRA